MIWKGILAATIAVMTIACGNNKADDTASRRKPANDIEAGIYRSGDSMMQALTSRDYNTFARFNHPAMLRVVGGQDNLADMVAQQMKLMPDSTMIRASIDSVLQVVKVNGELQCVVQQTFEMQMDTLKVVSVSYLIGESKDEGKSWTFFDGSNGGLITPKDIKPNLSPDLKIPAKRQETVLINKL